MKIHSVRQEEEKKMLNNEENKSGKSNQPFNDLVQKNVKYC